MIDASDTDFKEAKDAGLYFSAGDLDFQTSQESMQLNVLKILNSETCSSQEPSQWSTCLYNRNKMKPNHNGGRTFNH